MVVCGIGFIDFILLPIGSTAGTLVINRPITALGIAQCLYAIVLTCIYYRQKWSTIQWPKLVSISTTSPTTSSTSTYSHLHKQTLQQTLAFTLQSIFKHLLTEGDRIILSLLANSYDQGSYALATSYGGLICRIVFQPMEENGRLLFAHMHRRLIHYDSTFNHSTSTTNTTNISDHHDHDHTHKNDKLIMMDKQLKHSQTQTQTQTQTYKQKEQVKHILDQQYESYTTLLKLVLYIGCTFASLGSNYSPLLLRILVGRKWTHNNEQQQQQQHPASRALSTFCIYTLFLSMNGITEAFSYAISSNKRDVARLTLVHAIIGGVFYILAPPMVRWNGTVGLILCNCIGMGLRTIYSLSLSWRYFNTYRYKYYCTRNEKDNNVESKSKFKSILEYNFPFSYWKGIRHAIPHPIVLFGYILSHLLTRPTLWFQNHPIQYVGVGILCIIMLMILVYILERDFGKSLRAMVSQRQEVRKQGQQQGVHCGKSTFDGASTKEKIQ